jgi:hypothetical protein
VLRRCIKEIEHTRITVKANNRTAIFLNPERAKIKIVDLDCLLQTADAPKADYIVSKPTVADVIVELKGKDLGHAIEQILSTANYWRKAPPFSPVIGGLVVFTRSPERSAMLDNIKLKLLKNHRIWLEMDKSGLKEYQFETFIGARR